MKFSLALLILMLTSTVLLMKTGLDGPDPNQHQAIEDPVATIMDDAGLLASSNLTNDIRLNHQALLEDFDIDYRLITVNGIDDLNLFTARKFSGIRVGSLSASGRGLLLVIDVQHDLVRLEVGRNLEAVYTDSFIAYIEKKQMAPFFRKERLGEGILATTELIVTRAQEAEQNQAFSPPSLTEPSIGAGAISQAHIGKEAPSHASDYPNIPAADNPLTTVAAYIQAMESRNARPDLDIYSRNSREMLKSWVMTEAQMQNTVKEHRQCRNEQVKIEKSRAVVLYDREPRYCSPYLLRKEQGKWRIDLAFMQQYIRFDTDNHWHMPWGAKEFSFAFPDIKPYSAKSSDCRWCFTFNSDTLVITSIDRGSIGEIMGLQEGDKIIAIDKIKRPTMRKIFNYLYDVPEGQVVKISIARGIGRHTLSHPAPPK